MLGLGIIKRLKEERDVICKEKVKEAQRRKKNTYLDEEQLRGLKEERVRRNWMRGS